MAKPTWSSRADALLAWVAGDVWRYEKQLREGIPQKLMVNSTQLLERVGEFLNALNQLEPFDISRGFKVEAIRWHAKDKNIQWKESQRVERPSWLSEHVLKGQFGEIGLEALHDSTLRLRRAFQDRESAKTQGKELARNPRETRPQERERGKAQVMDEAQRTIFWRKEEEKKGSCNSEGKSRDMVTRKIQSSLEICLGQTIMLPASFTANPLIISVEASEEEVKMCILLLLFH
ncbi:hypothetical protein H4I95_02713 [Botrytis cinerea]